MPRNPRLHVQGGLYHSILRGNHRQAIFHTATDYLYFEDVLGQALERYGARLHAYCWMPNHVHLAVQVGEAPLGRLMQLVASRYARRKQWRVATTGHLFERRYRAMLVQSDRYLFALVRYIHLNPVRAAIARDPADYEWSSHRAYLGLATTRLIQIAAGLGTRADERDTAVAAYRSFMAREPAPDEVFHYHPEPPGQRRGRDGTRQASADPQSGTAGRDLEAIVVEVAQENGVDPALIRSARRLPALVRARAEVARRALREGVANLSQVALHLGRVPSSLSELLSKDHQ